MLENLKKAHQDEDEYKRRALKTRADAEMEFRATVGIQCAVSLHIGKLYGSVGQVSCARPKYESIDKLPAPTWADVERLRAMFVPVEMEYRKGTFTSIRPEAYQDKDKRATDTVQAIAPAIVRVKPGEWQECSVEWYGQNSDGEVWRVKVELPYHLGARAEGFGRVELRYTSTAFGRKRKVEFCELYPTAPFQRIRWSAGGREYPNEFTLYAIRAAGESVWDKARAVLAEDEKRERENTYRTPTPKECLQSFAEYLKIDLETAREVRKRVIESADSVNGAVKDWKRAKEWFREWVSASGTTQTMYPFENGWYQLAGSLPDGAGEKYHAGNNKRNCNTMRPEDGGRIEE